MSLTYSKMVQCYLERETFPFPAIFDALGAAPHLSVFKCF